ncbi:MAG TPA: RNA polymerase-binding protein DksA [Candidatus Tenderia sp.]|nr:RNA polymerase-binding protein DksA [Candidatus Tenderia sp.]
MAPVKKKATSTKKAAAKKKVATKKKAASATAVKKKSTAKKMAASKPSQTSKASDAKKKADNLLQGYGDFTPYEPKKGEEYMNEAQVEHFRAILQSWKQALMHEVDRTMHYMKDEAANFPDPNDRATQESDFTMELRARDRERKLIKKIEESIEMLDMGDYGYCESCGIEIGIRRLEARPTANLCIDCKTLEEIKEKQRKG